MAGATRYLVDTNILLRISRVSDPQQKIIGASLKELERQGAELFYTLQNVAEFWNVCTRPAESNGYGLSIGECEKRVGYIENTMTLLPDTERVYAIWRRLILNYGVRGVQVHDARLAAVMQAYGVSRLLTLNRPDFQRSSEVQAIHPSEVLS
ncbi:MAG TPA: type II toxin-antitoxin system VapC family toxin [Terracidiphilus sp.]|nr:type II toxin-antitoxin system VapC family toxin [Terracidiphilus sp.]